MTTFKVEINLDKKCSRCKKPGAVTESGLCLSCINKGIKRGDYDHILKPMRNPAESILGKCSEISKVKP